MTGCPEDLLGREREHAAMPISGSKTAHGTPWAVPDAASVPHWSQIPCKASSAVTIGKSMTYPMPPTGTAETTTINTSKITARLSLPGQAGAGAELCHPLLQPAAGPPLPKSRPGRTPSWPAAGLQLLQPDVLPLHHRRCAGAAMAPAASAIPVCSHHGCCSTAGTQLQHDTSPNTVDAACWKVCACMSAAWRAVTPALQGQTAAPGLQLALRQPGYFLRGSTTRLRPLISCLSRLAGPEQQSRVQMR